MADKKHFEFINSQTGNTIAYLSIPASLTKEQQLQKLEQKRASLATEHKLRIDLVYWQDKSAAIG
nr:hypothetical protein [uncultured Mucilaginibacter sp.]